MDLPLVSVLIVTWNRKHDVLQTVGDVYDQVYPHLEVIVVDNGSHDGTVEALREAYPAVKVVGLPKNAGVSAGRNAGLKVAQGEIIFCLDSDASPAADALVNIVARFQQDPALGVINSKILNAYTRQIDGGPGWAYTAKDLADQDTEFLSWSFSEGGGAIRRAVLDEVGPFWARLFFGCEGQELSLRVWNAGYKVLYFPRSVVYHRESPESRIVGTARDCRFFRYTLYIYLTRYPWWLLALMMPLKTAALLVRGSRGGYLREVLATLAGVFAQLPLLLRWREPIRHRTAWMYLGLMRQHGPLRWDPITWLKAKKV